LQVLIRGLALLIPKLKLTAVYHKIVLLAEQDNQKTPSYTTIYNVVRKIKPALSMLSHEGVKAYRQKYELIYRRECKAPNDIWQCDHTELDIYVFDSEGREVKPGLTIILDDYSRVIAGFLLSIEAPSSINTVWH
jgi:putative transposase